MSGMERAFGAKDVAVDLTVNLPGGLVLVRTWVDGWPAPWFLLAWLAALVGLFVWAGIRLQRRVDSLVIPRLLLSLLPVRQSFERPLTAEFHLLLRVDNILGGRVHRAQCFARVKPTFVPPSPELEAAYALGNNEPVKWRTGEFIADFSSQSEVINAVARAGGAKEWNFGAEARRGRALLGKIVYRLGVLVDTEDAGEYEEEWCVEMNIQNGGQLEEVEWTIKPWS